MISSSTPRRLTPVRGMAMVYRSADAGRLYFIQLMKWDLPEPESPWIATCMCGASWDRNASRNSWGCMVQLVSPRPVPSPGLGFVARNGNSEWTARNIWRDAYSASVFSTCRTRPVSQHK